MNVPLFIQRRICKFLDHDYEQLCDRFVLCKRCLEVSEIMAWGKYCGKRCTKCWNKT